MTDMLKCTLQQGKMILKKLIKVIKTDKITR